LSFLAKKSRLKDLFAYRKDNLKKDKIAYPRAIRSTATR